MKLRLGFVSNSSSSSFVVIFATNGFVANKTIKKEIELALGYGPKGAQEVFSMFDFSKETIHEIIKDYEAGFCECQDSCGLEEAAKILGEEFSAFSVCGKVQQEYEARRNELTATISSKVVTKDSKPEKKDQLLCSHVVDCTWGGDEEELCDLFAKILIQKVENGEVPSLRLLFRSEPE